VHLTMPSRPRKEGVKAGRRLHELDQGEVKGGGVLYDLGAIVKSH
jgi:hypothetical protein